MDICNTDSMAVNWFEDQQTQKHLPKSTCRPFLLNQQDRKNMRKLSKPLLLTQKQTQILSFLKQSSWPIE